MVQSAPKGLSQPVQKDWTALNLSPCLRGFDPADVADGPEPLRRWLTRALSPGVPLATAVEVRMHGRIRLGSWRRFVARQRLSLQDGFVWAATARVFGLPVRGFDRFTRDSGEMRWRALGALPVMSDTGDDITRSAAGRHAGEVLLACPAAALDPRILCTSVDPERIRVAVPVGRWVHGVTLTVDEDGDLRELVMRRWRGSDGPPASEQVFGARLGNPRTFGGQTVPTAVSAGWSYGTNHWREGKFIEYYVDDVRPLGTT